jgi:hypothetical protein
MEKLNKKGMSLNDMPGLAITFVIIAIVLGIGATIMTSIQDDQTADSFAYNSSQAGLEAINEFSSWQSTLAIIVVSAVVIGVVSMFFRRRNE